MPFKKSPQLTEKNNPAIATAQPAAKYIHTFFMQFCSFVKFRFVNLLCSRLSQYGMNCNPFTGTFAASRRAALPAMRFGGGFACGRPRMRV